jgi:hypothetical protein
MIKYSFLLLNFFGLLGLQLFFDDGVIIEDTTPATMQPGQTERVDLTINKGDLAGFAKLELVLPAGLKASVVDAHGASFTFSGQKAKFIWMTLPNEQDFTVSYNLSAEPSANGNLIIRGIFSYIKENQRVDYEMQSKLVAIGLAGTTASDNTSTTEPANTTTTPPVTVPDGELACIRTVSKISTSEYLVNLKVVNASLKGFAKIMEQVPNGFVVEEDDSDGAITTIEPHGIKYVWFEAPELKEFEVTYRLQATSSNQVPQLSGTFSYIKDNTPQEMAVRGGESIDTSPLASNTDKTTTPEETKPDEAKANDTANTTTDKASNTTADKKTTPPVVTSVPNPETGVSYRVQIVAGHNTVGKSYFKSRHSFAENFVIENHEGWVKYTTGTHNAYRGARDERERINTSYNFMGPFVTAYNDGVRITVQEALMITNQKWYQ